MAISSFKSFLMMKGTSDYEKLVDIKDFPDLGGAPEMLKTTTLSDGVDTNIEGVQKNDGYEFTANYTKEDYEKLVALKGMEKEFAVWFGGTESNGTVTPNGSEGKWTFKGTLSVYVTGAGVNEVVEMKLTIAASTVIAPATT